jgi:regulator of RNase E activity RraA
VIYDPATTRQVGNAFVRDAFVGNRIPASRINPIAAKLINLFPLPNAAGDAITRANNYLLSFKDPVFDNGLVARIDHRFSERHAIFGRFTKRHFRVVRQGNFKNEVTEDYDDRVAPGFAFDDTLTLNPTLILNFRYGFSRFYNTGRAANFGTDPASFGFPAALVAQLPVKSIPQIAITGYTTLSGANKFLNSAEDSHSFRTGATKIAGQHTFRFGGEYRLLRSNPGSFGSAAAGAYSFNSTFTRGPNPQVASVTAGVGLASFLLGLGSGGSVDKNVATAEQGKYFGFYFQDDFRLSRKLTLNLGLRYEWEGDYTERYNRLNRGYDFTTASPLEQQAKTNYAANPIAEIPAASFNVKGGLLFTGVNGQPRGLTNLDRNNVSPRIGLAFSLTPKTIIRGGYGLFYGATTLLSEARLGFSVSTPWVVSNDGSLTPANTLSNPFPNGLLTPTGASLGLNTLVGQGISFTDPNRKAPFTQQYSLTIQRELPGGVLLDVAYAGTLGRDLSVNQQLNAIPLQFVRAAQQTFAATGRNVLNDSVQNPFFGLIAAGPLAARTVTRGQLLRPYPHFTGITALNRSLGRSRYDAFQLKASRRFANGFSVLVSYTNAKQLDQIRFLNDQDTELTKELSQFDIPVRADLLKTIKEDANPQRQLVESIGVGEVLVMDARGTTASATIGNILTTRAQMRGAAGIVSDGCFRDSPAIAAMDFPTYARGRHAGMNTSALFPADINVPIGCGGVAVVPGDVIVGDAEGVIIIPYPIVEEVAAAALAQEQIEDFILEKVRGGASTIALYPPNDAVREEFRQQRA